MVHVRLNQKTESPNPHINFISSLPGPSQDDASKLLHALAAQVKPVMKAHGFTVNSLEEYECNKVFLGRNWNAGETIELVLRKANGAFWPIQHLIAVFCHELSHIKHMNHLPAFHKLRIQLENEVRALREKHYFGDGLYSAGTRLGDSAVISSEVGVGDIPEYICGGAHQNSRPSSLKRRRRAPASGGPSSHTGRQTSKRRKAGARVRSAYAFGGPEGAATGRMAGEDVRDEESKRRGAGFGKSTRTKTARELRALAAERRARQLVQERPLFLDDSSDTEDHIHPDHPRQSDESEHDSQPEHSHPDSDDGGGVEDEDEDEPVRESDAQRREAMAMLSSSQGGGPGGDGEQEKLNLAFDSTSGKLVGRPTAASASASRSIVASSSSVPSTSAFGSGANTGKGKGKGKGAFTAGSLMHDILVLDARQLAKDHTNTIGAKPKPLPGSSSSSSSVSGRASRSSRLASESTAAAASSSRIHVASDVFELSDTDSDSDSEVIDENVNCPPSPVANARRREDSSDPGPGAPEQGDEDSEQWACGACTMLNHPDYALCSMCATRRGTVIQ